MTAIDGPAGAPRDPAALADILAATHRDQLALCAALEAIADSLPRDVDHTACITVARALGPLIASAHALEEEAIFPTIEAQWPGLFGMGQTIERLKYEHMEDICFSEELFDALMAYGRGRPRPAPDAFGYMLRGFFESLRRHIAFEGEVIVPLLRAASAQAALAIIPLHLEERR